MQKGMSQAHRDADNIPGQLQIEKIPLAKTVKTSLMTWLNL
jgi:hypothetical protein